jgi:hypothetical protein
MARRGYLSRLRWLWLLIAAASLWLRTGFPIQALAFGEADDELFIRMARSITAGHWLGAYDNLTLAKGAFYPIFIALASFSGIALKVAEQLLYLGAAALVSVVIIHRSGRRWAGTLTFALLALNPILWNSHLARVVREGIYGSLALLIVAMLLLLAFPSPSLTKGRRLLLGAVLGLTTAAFWLTREEGVWLLPAMAVVLVIGLVDWHRQRHQHPLPWSRRWLAWGMPLAIAGLAFLASTAVVKGINARHYGVFEANEFKSASFQRGYGALSRVGGATWQRYVVFPAAARQRAYAVSPAARALAPAFEGPIGAAWRRVGCEQMFIPDTACPEILSGWFMWALRDAVAAAGFYRSAPEAAAFYNRLADEIDAACSRGELDCLPARATLAPPFRPHYVLDSLAPAWTLSRLLFTLRDGPPKSLPSRGPPAGIAIFADVAGTVVPPISSAERLQGWVAAKAALPDVYVRGRAGATAAVSMLRWSGEDVRSVYPDMQAVRFRLESDCASIGCELVVIAAGQTLVLPWGRVAPGMINDDAAFRIFIEQQTTMEVTATSGQRRTVQQFIARLIGRVYAVAIPVLAALGVLGTVLALCLLRPLPVALVALAAGSAAAIASRIALLAYLDATSIPSANILYVSPASPFVLVLAGLGLCFAVALLQQGRRGNTGAAL